MISREELLRRCTSCEPPISDPELNVLRAQFENRFPESLALLLKVANGFDFDNGDVAILGSSELFELNESMGVLEGAPNHILFATTGGSEYALISRLDGSIKLGAYGAWTDDGLLQLAPDLNSWLRSKEMFPKTPDAAISAIEPVYIYIDRMPPGGLSDLMVIKKAVAPASSVAQMKMAADQAPAALSTSTSYTRACRSMEAVGKLAECLSIRLASDPSVRLPLVY